MAMGETPRFWVAFGILLSALALSAVMLVILTINAHAATEPAQAIVDINNSPGGNLKEFYQNYKKLSDEHTVVRLHGYCASACTLLLLREFTGIKACAADERAIFAFHKPFTFDAHHNIVKTKTAARVSRAMWAEMLADFPYDVYNLLKDARIPSASEGADPSDLFVVPAFFFVPKCEVAAQ
jgi:hypothetical protein